VGIARKVVGQAVDFSAVCRVLCVEGRKIMGEYKRLFEIFGSFSQMLFHLLDHNSQLGN
jgi:hypothetical protein